MGQIRQVAYMTFVIQIGSAVFGLVTSVLLTHWFGPKQFGIYSYVLAITGIAGVMGGLGFSTLLLRQTATWKLTANWKSVKGLLLHSAILTLTASSVLGFLIWIIGLRLGHFHQNSGFKKDLLLAIILMVLTVESGLITSALQGLNKVVASLIPSSLGVPLFLLIFVSWIHWSSGLISISTVLDCQIGLTLILTIVQAAQFFRAVPREFFSTFIRIRFPAWLYNAAPFLVNGMFTTINLRADIFLLGVMKGPAAAGIYTAATRGALLLVLALSAIVTASQPTLATLYAQGEIAHLKQVLTMTSRLALLISLIGCTILIVLRRVLLGLLFGPAFTYGATALVILSVARVINASTGSLAPFLAMTNQAKILSISLGTEAILNVALNYLLIPIMGLNGSAIATGGSMALMNIVLASWVYRYRGYDVSFLGLRHRDKERVER